MFVTEGEPDEDDFRFFGYVCGQAEEWGYFVLSELESSRGPGGLTVERDLPFRASAVQRDLGAVPPRARPRVGTPLLFF